MFNLVVLPHQFILSCEVLLVLQTRIKCSSWRYSKEISLTFG